MFRRRPDRARRVPAVAAVIAALTAAMVGLCLPAAAYAATPLTGTFTLTAGSCSGSTVSGSYFRMILPSGSPAGPFMSNSDSTCSDQSYTALATGTDGGLVSGSYQPSPNPPFAPSGAALAHRITATTPFFGTGFATATNPTDPQTKRSVPAPQIWATGNSLSADLRSFAVTWNSQHFNQGAPKPDGSLPGNTRAATGTYDAATGAFTLQWTSQIVGGPFDKFTGLWHVAGRFVPASAVAAVSPSVPNSTRVAAAGDPVTGRPAASAPTAATAGAGTPARVLQAADSPVEANAHPRVTASAAASAAGNPGEGPQQAVASTTTVTRDRWSVSGWVLTLVAAIAVAGFVSLIALNRLAARKAVSS